MHARLAQELQQAVNLFHLPRGAFLPSTLISHLLQYCPLRAISMKLYVLQALPHHHTSGRNATQCTIALKTIDRACVHRYTFRSGIACY